MPDFVRFPLVLLFVSGLAGAILGLVNGQTEKIIAERQAEKSRAALAAVLPGADPALIEESEIPDPLSTPARPRTIRTATAYRDEADRKAGRILGYAVDGEGVGYQSAILVKVGMKEEGGRLVIIGMTIISQSETPGLGTKILDVKSERNLMGMLMGRTYPDEKTLNPEFPSRFSGLAADDARLKADGGKVDGISSVTVSSRATCKAVADAVRRLKAALAAQRKEPAR